MSRQFELFERAAECGRLMEAAIDPVKKQTLEQLRNMWIALANESPTMPADDMTKKIADTEKLQRDLSQ